MDTVLGDGVTVELDEGLYPKDAVYGAAYVFLDRCYVHLDRAGDRRIRVTLKPKKEGVDAAAMAGDFQNELLGQAWRRHIADDNRAFIESIATRALSGAAGPPGLDDLLSMEIGEDTAFEDPLGIAMSWEEKYANSKPRQRTSSGKEKAVEPSEAVPPEPSSKPGGDRR